MEVVIEGTVFKIESKDYYVFDESGKEFRCSLKGRFQKEFSLKKDKLYAVDIACVGDKVEFDLNKDGSGVIKQIKPRKNYISRKAPRLKGAGVRGERLEQIIASNLDNVIIVSSCDQPKFNNRLIDRILVAAESSHVQPVIVINKIDLDKKHNYKLWVQLYKSLGYGVLESSVVEKIGVINLKKILEGKTNLVCGQSGVGKSSLLNSLYPVLNLKVGTISNYTSKGTHTTVTSVMKKVDVNTFIIDTPGIREMDPYGIKKEDLSHYFRDLSEYLNECKFNTCTHYHEPGCGVVEALKQGKISKERYQSYLNLLETIEEDLFFS